MGAKILGITLLFGLLLFGAVFAYFRKELDAIRPSELAKRVSTTVTSYYDRNGTLLWEDKGASNYRLVVKESEIAPCMGKATIAIEDKDFYKHGGISLTGITRAFFNNFSNTGGGTQGGSTLTQQLVKQVFFADEAQNRGLGGVPRKLKEAILAVEVERMYNKNQILNLYLNESPYGGRRNGVESAAQTYFNKPAKDLTLPECALLASIPQSPSVYNPYNVDGHNDLLERQRHTLNNMVDQKFITKKEAEEAKKVAILDTIKPETDQYANIKAPHFVQYVRSQLEKELGKATVGRGGLKVTTTLDLRVQNVVQEQMTQLFNSYLPASANFDNGAATIVDNQTGQILALQGSRDYNYPGYGQDNAAVSFIQPGSSIKPLVYATLFKQRPGQNYGTGTILADEPIDQIYGAKLNNFDNRFKGRMTIRQALAESRNIPAVKAMYIAGRDETIKTIHEIGDKSYCTDGVDKEVGLAAAIGGCGLKQVEHANSFATLARGGVYKPVSSILEVKNSNGEKIKQWKDESKQVLDPQIPYMLESILSDDNARAPSFGRGASGLNVPGVKTFTKTGTSNLGLKSKDLWMNSVSTKATLSFWVGNHDTRPMSNALSSIVGPSVGRIMSTIHKDIFVPEGTWKTGDWFVEPAGVQKIGGELFPSWYTKQVQSSAKIVFDKVSKKKATTCTPDGAKIEVDVTKTIDPVTKKEIILAGDGYDASKDDDVHKCDDVKPFIGDVTATSAGSGQYTLSASVTQGTHTLQTVSISIDGQAADQAAGGTGSYSRTVTLTPGAHTVIVTVTDTAFYTGTITKTVTVSGP
jgi:penicillin-binding protein 1A